MTKKERETKYYLDHKEEIKKKRRKHYLDNKEVYHQRAISKYKEDRIILDDLREKLFNKYGYECGCCKENIKQLLTIDHIKNDGNKHRKIFKSQIKLWTDILENGTKNEYRILCHNCNWAYGRYGRCFHD